MAKDFNSQHVVDGYDVHIRKLIPATKWCTNRFKHCSEPMSMNMLHVLIVGCGTGYELGYLLQLFPNWSFTATDLSATMLDKAKQYIQPLDALHRVEFALADVDQLKTEQTYDAALSILVTHFVPYAQKLNFLKQLIRV